jgi:GrpB-like predicted nucleotidyltransferase (UPF0157 family)
MSHQDFPASHGSGSNRAPSAFSQSLDARLAAARVEPSAEPQATWRRLRQDVHLEVVPYDLSWPGRYERWRDRLDEQLGATAPRIEHVGSTAVPGLLAKPVIDIQISVPDLNDESRYVTQVEQAGVQLRSRDALHRFFRPFAGQPRDVHVHVCQAGSDWEREHILFRDYLRSHVDARDAYAKVKQEAAQVWSDDRIAYTEAKTGVVLDQLDAAEIWAMANSWAVIHPPG